MCIDQRSRRQLTADGRFAAAADSSEGHSSRAQACEQAQNPYSAFFLSIRAQAMTV